MTRARFEQLIQTITSAGMELEEFYTDRSMIMRNVCQSFDRCVHIVKLDGITRKDFDAEPVEDAPDAAL